MNVSKKSKIAFGIAGIIVFATVISILALANMGIVHIPNNLAVSLPESFNPIQSYKINTTCELFDHANSLDTPGFKSFFINSNGYLWNQYPNEMKNLKELVAPHQIQDYLSEYGSFSGLPVISKESKEIVISIMMKEWSVNPKLKQDFMEMTIQDNFANFGMIKNCT